MIASDTEKITCTNSEKQTLLPLGSGKKGLGLEDLVMMAAAVVMVVVVVVEEQKCLC